MKRVIEPIARNKKAVFPLKFFLYIILFLVLAVIFTALLWSKLPRWGA